MVTLPTRHLAARSGSLGRRTALTGQHSALRAELEGSIAGVPGDRHLTNVGNGRLALLQALGILRDLLAWRRQRPSGSTSATAEEQRHESAERTWAREEDGQVARVDALVPLRLDLCRAQPSGRPPGGQG
jgi:hypothetical protein